MDRSLLKRTAAQSLSAAGNTPQKLGLIHKGAAAVLSLTVCAVAKLLLRAMDNTSGLSAMGTQSMLSTAAVVVQLLPVVLSPFWSAGLVCAMLNLSRGKAADTSTLLEGFRRFGPVLSSGLFRLMQYIAMALVASYLGTQLFLCTPLAQPLYAAALQGITDFSQISLSTGAQLAYGGIVLAVFAVLSAPIFYRYRMTSYAIMDGASGLQALFLSSTMTRRRRLELLRLDLSFWWVYALVLLAGFAANAAVLLDLPGELAYWSCAIIGVAAQVAIYALAMPKVVLTYAHCYEEYRQAPAPEPQRRPSSKSVPWEGWQ